MAMVETAKEYFVEVPLVVIGPGFGGG